MDAIHRDEAIYPHANRFNPFRFTQPSLLRSILDSLNPEQSGGKPTSSHSRTEKENTSISQITASGSKVKSTVALDDTFLGFGFGKHACPGRFFALNEMKIFVAHMVLNYDVVCLDRRPELTNVLWLKVPYNDGRVRVRKRV